MRIGCREEAVSAEYKAENCGEDLGFQDRPKGCMLIHRAGTKK